MAGKIKQVIDSILIQKTRDNPQLENVIKAKMVLKGVMPNKYTIRSDDDPVVLEKLYSIMKELKMSKSI